MPPADQPADQPEVVNEIKEYIDARFIGSVEAAYRLSGCTMHDEVPNIIRLQVHLENEQHMCFGATANLETIIANPPETTLTAFFKMNFYNQELGVTNTSDILYHNMPATHSFNKANKSWVPRTRHLRFTHVGRVYFVSPQHVELCVSTPYLSF